MLTVKEIEAAKAPDKTRKLFDGKGLFLEVTPGGSKRWRLKYRFHGKEKLLSMGVYGEVSLKEAREKRDEARALLVEGIDPSVERKARKAEEAEQAQQADQPEPVDPGDSFETVAREWFEQQSRVWAASHAVRIIQRLERDIFPRLGGRPMADITPPEALDVLRAIERRGAYETAHRAAANMGQVFRYAVATGRCERDAIADLKGALAPVKVRHHPAITDPKAFGALLLAIDGYQGHELTHCGLRLAPLVFVRPGELRQAEWSEVDLDEATWIIPASKMKTKQDHIVPLARQAVAILEELHALTRAGRYVFPSIRSRSRPMSNNTLNAALRRLGYSRDEVVVHGFRATARTLLDEVLEERPDIIEAQLAHRVVGPLGRAYNRTSFLKERRAMMQRWADYLDGLRAAASRSHAAG